MILLLSPSKTLDFNGVRLPHFTQPEFLKESQVLIDKLRGYTPKKLAGMMGISDKLATLNVQRYRDFHTPFTPENARQAVLAFRGDVYDGLGADRFRKADFEFAQAHLRILSGLYGLLRPLDLIQPYRLEMGIRLPTKRGRDLYAFWGGRIAQAIHEALAGQKHAAVVNLASEEYFKAVQPQALKAPLLHIVFKEYHKGKLQVIGLHAKKARGMMAAYAIRHRVENPQILQEFNENGYRFEPSLSDAVHWLFAR